MDTPQILLFDCDKTVSLELSTNKYKHYNATMGNQDKISITSNNKK